MLRVGDIFEGVEVVWALWAFAVGILLGGLVRLARRLRRPSLSAAARDESGLSYTLSYVMAIPVYLFFLCAAYEATWLLVAKIGTLYAAHAGARAAVVWESAQPADRRDDRIAQSVHTAMAPFATTSYRHLMLAGGAPPDAFLAMEEFVLAYEQYSSKSAAQAPPRPRPYRQTNAPPESLRLWYLNAAARTEYRYEVDRNRPDGPVRFTVTYRAPLRIPIIARWLDPDGGAPYEFPVRSYATLPNEAPDTRDRTLGIDYRSEARFQP